MAPWWRTERDPPRHSLNWPWYSRWWKPTSDRRDLIKAAALLVAEIALRIGAADQQFFLDLGLGPAHGALSEYQFGDRVADRR